MRRKAFELQLDRRHRKAVQSREGNFLAERAVSNVCHGVRRSVGLRGISSRRCMCGLVSLRKKVFSARVDCNRLRGCMSHCEHRGEEGEGVFHTTIV